MRAAHSDYQIDLQVERNSQGVWHGRRLQQLLGDLVLNAINYGAPDAPVRVTATGEEEIRFKVKNNGVVIEQQTLAQIFDPLRRGPDRETRYDEEAAT